jgi:hypothetical protein
MSDRHPSTAPHTEQRVSTLVGDRLCTHCGYNLTGQAVLREPHYQLLIVRCPECGAAASVQEYPLLGRWAGRWAAVVAAAWFLFLVLFWVGSAAAIFGFSTGTAEIAAEEYRTFLQDRYNAWAKESPDPIVITVQPGAGAPVLPAPPLIRANEFADWWKTQDPAALLADAGGWFAAVDWSAAFLWIPLGLLAFVFGCMWATILVARGRRALLVWGGAIMFVACAFATIPMSDWLAGEPSWYWTGARQQICPRMMVLSLAFGAVTLVIGLMVGRSLVRGMIRLLLPPRMRSSLAGLWLADGLNPPDGRIPRVTMKK